jgi:hypothetical protein
MNRQDVQLLQSIEGYPLLSLLLPTHRTAPENQQDPIRVKNLQTEAVDRLSQEFSQREVAPLLKQLDELIAEIDYQYALDGLALFVGQDFARKFYLPFTITERVVIDHTFATRDLVFAMNRSPRYWVLSLSEQPTQLFEATRDALEEVRQGNKFPMTHGGPGGGSKLPGGAGINTSAVRDDQHRQFFRKVDNEFNEVTVNDPLPLLLVGIDRYFSFYKEVAANPSSIIGTVSGNHEKTPLDELGKLTWEVAEQYFADRREKVMQELDDAISAQKCASTIGEVWRMAKEGRGDLLLVEEDYHYPATVDETGMHITPAEDAAAPGVIDDAVDEVIETVMAMGGRVTFVENGKLDQHQRIALILRY